MKKTRLPGWLKKKLPSDSRFTETENILDSLHLETVCQNAKCPNIWECFSRHIATFMIMGGICTRNCGFCGVKSGKPEPLDKDEPRRIAEAVKRLGLRHAVITSVTRDDLEDGGADHFASVIYAIKESQPGVSIEVLVPDFAGKEECIRKVVYAGPDVFNHNIETVPRLYPFVRPEADYKRSLEVLALANRLKSGIRTKSGLMLGLGETGDEVLNVLSDLQESACNMLTMGQYLSPSERNNPVVEFIAPEVFSEYEKTALRMGFKSAYCGPFVRSSYNAQEFVKTAEN